MLNKATLTILCAFVWIFAFVSCTQQRMAFRFADTAASWKADDYFDLSSSQKDEVKKHLKIFFKKSYEHNDRKIPKLFERADQVLATVSEQNKLDCREIEKIRIQSATLITDLATVAAPYVKTLTETLNEKQIRYFVSQVKEKVEQDEKKSKNMAEQEGQRLSRTLDNLSLFLGSVSKEQQTEVHTYLIANPFPYEEQLKNKKANSENLKTASAAPETFKIFILDYLQNWRSYQSAAYLKLADELRLKNERFYQNLICQASVKQLKHFRNKLFEVKKDFEDILIQK